MKIEHYPFRAKPLPWPADSLEPAVSRETITLHYELYKGYVDRLNRLIAANGRYSRFSVYDFLTHRRSVPYQLSCGLLFNAGGMYNHELYFSSLTPHPCDIPPAFRKRLERTLGTEEQAEKAFLAAAEAFKGSGYLVLAADRCGRIRLICVRNQDIGYLAEYAPLAAADVWEHSYLLDRGGDRTAYIKAIFSHMDWEKAAMRLKRLNI